jgi:type I restriction enzyme S subunit
MKDSGIEWIGEIPEDWDTVKIKHLAAHKEGLFLDGDWIESDIITSEGVRYLTTGNIGEGYFKEQGDGFISEETLKKMNCLIVYPGDLVISRLNKPIGRACLLPYTHDKYVIAVDNVVLRPNPKLYNRLFLKFAMNIDGYSEEANMISRGATMPRISRTLLGNIKLPIPSSDEQQKIANFLDKKVAEIDHILVKTRESIEEYKKYKQSLITEAVTKGLNPDVKMKDSGIEWIGEIPEHWEITRLKNLLDSPLKYGANSSGITYDENLPRYIRITDVTLDNNLKGDGKLSLPIEEAEEFLLTDNDILFARSGATVGKTFLYKEDYGLSAFAGYLIKASVSDINEPEFIYYYTLSSAYNEWKNRIFIQATIQNIGANKYSNMEIVIPSNKDEQIEIVKFIQEKTSHIDNLISQKEQLLSDFEAYKKSLIYECVTGKREVV